MAALFTYDRFEPGTLMGSVAMTFDDAFVALWEGIYPFDPVAGDVLPAGVSTVVLMNAWRTIVDPRPPGNVHAGQQVRLSELPRRGEAITTEVVCLSKEQRKGRLFVRLETRSTGTGGRMLFTAETNLIWAQ